MKIYKNGAWKEFKLGTDITVDSELSSSSTNPVENRVIYKALNSSSGSVDLSNIIEAEDNYFKRNSLMTVTKTSVTIPKGMQINIGGKGYVSTAAATLDISTAATAADRAGKDLYVYACQPTDTSSREPAFVVSMNSTVPSGYTADNSRKIGGFHCLCVDVGTGITNYYDGTSHKLNGYVAGDILPASVWDLKFRSTSANEGMVWISTANIWMDIYLASWDGEKLVSVYNGTIADGESDPSINGEEMREYFGMVGKRPFNWHEYTNAARSANQFSYITKDPGTTGGHSDNNGRRMITDDGVEDIVGVSYQWSDDQCAYGLETDVNGNNYYPAGEYVYGGCWSAASGSDYLARCCSRSVGSNGSGGTSFRLSFCAGRGVGAARVE